MDRTQVIRSLIENTGMNLKAFSEKAGIPYTTLRSILDRGIGNASVDKVIKICKALDIAVEDLENIDPYQIPSPKVCYQKQTYDRHNKWVNMVVREEEESYVNAIINDTASKKLLGYFEQLNEDGKEEAIKRVEELTYIPKYQLESECMPIAAHNDDESVEQLELMKQDIDEL